jgi:hypothetical protein
MQLGTPTTKRSIFVSYHHGGDRAYYAAFSGLFADTYHVIQDNSVERLIDSDDVEYVLRKIREDYITGSSDLGLWTLFSVWLCVFSFGL